jgi:protein TonB
VIDETAGPGRASRATGAQSAESASKQLPAAGAVRRTNGAGARQPQRAAAARPITRRGGNASPAARAFGVVGVSLGTHMALMGVLGFMPSPNDFFASHKVEMEIIAPKPPPAPPPKVEEPPKPPEPEPERPKAAPKPAAPKPAEPEPPKQEAKAAPEAPVDLTGVTLTGGDSTWSSVVGTGGALNGPAPRVAAVTSRDRNGSASGVVNGKGDKPVLVAEASLSRAALPPEGMDALLEQNFPPRARAQGVSGSALLRVTILADGRVGDMRVMRETGDYGFGAACQKTLRLKRWQPPLDRRGQPVATEVRYSCEFEVAY